jgi:hypothetical protein
MAVPFYSPLQPIGLVFIVFGLLYIVARDFVWRAEQFSDRLRGKRSERTPLWNFWKIMIGVLAVVLGLTLLLQ